MIISAGTGPARTPPGARSHRIPQPPDTQLDAALAGRSGTQRQGVRASAGALSGDNTPSFSPSKSPSVCPSGSIRRGCQCTLAPVRWAVGPSGWCPDSPAGAVFHASDGAGRPKDVREGSSDPLVRGCRRGVHMSRAAWWWNTRPPCGGRALRTPPTRSGGHAHHDDGTAHQIPRQWRCTPFPGRAVTPGAPSPLTFLQIVAGIIPATILVIFVGMVGMTAITLGTERRAYALDFIDRSIDLMWAILGVRRRPAASRHRRT